MLSREEILGKEDLPVEDVPVPEWGGSVGIRTMTATEKVEFSRDIDTDDTSKGDFMSQLVALTACDKDGNALFTKEDVLALGKKNGNAMSELCDAAQRINKMGKKYQDETEKNSETEQTSSAT